MALSEICLKSDLEIERTDALSDRMCMPVQVKYKTLLNCINSSTRVGREARRDRTF